MPELELAIVVPTFKEQDNIGPLLARLSAVLPNTRYEVIFVDDDSPDGTGEIVRSIGIENSAVRLIRRINRRGLASACVEGMLSTAAPFIAVMDADLQHDEAILPQMLAKLRDEQLDIVVATRNSGEGSMGDFSEARVRLSNLGRRLSNLVSRSDLSDPMSGFFVLDRRFLDEVAHAVSGIGFKILLDILASAKRPVRLGEVPYHFRQRIHGESKLDILVGLEYMQLLLDKVIGEFVPVRFVVFSLVGAMGAAVHLSILAILLKAAGQPFVVAQTAATVVVMTVNFFLNNAITYRSQRLKGRSLVPGLLSFYLACSVGAFINIRIAIFLTQGGLHWYAAGLAGLVVSSVWNYAVTAIFTWRRARLSAGRIHRPVA